MPKIKKEKHEEPDIKIEPSCEGSTAVARKDPTSFLPDEPMSYEIKKKKKKKKKEQEDPFKDVVEKIITPVTILKSVVDPEVNIKVEDIEVDLDFNDFNNDEEPYQNIHEPIVKIEQPSHEACILTFEQVINDSIKKENEEKKEMFTNNIPNHVCNICHLVFKTAKTLAMHQRRKHKAYRKFFQHICDYCGMSYETKNSLVAHIRRKHNGEDYQKEKACEICALVFKGDSRLRMHMRRKHNMYSDTFRHKCPECGLTYDKYRSLITHIQRKHSKTEEQEPPVWYNCPFCQKVFGKRETYARHVQRNHQVDEDGNVKPKVISQEILKNCVNTESGDIMCKECPLVFSSIGFLKLHMRRKHNALKENFRLKCKICSLSFEKIESLKRHIKRKHESTYCHVCNKDFDSKEAMAIHKHIRPIRECSICGLIFATQGGLSKHMRCIHKKDLPKSEICHICSEGFFDKRQLQVHLRKVHLKIYYECHTCNKKFVGKESYRRHMLLKHSKQGPTNVNQEQKCEHCSEIFTDENLLCNHINLVHSAITAGPKSETLVVEIKKEDEVNKDSYQCTKCAVQCNTWEELKAHYEQNHHIGEESQCQKCGEIVRKNDLDKHIKTVHQIKLTCKYCEFTCKNKISMTQHLLRHKNIKTLHCDYNECRYKTYYDDAMEKHKKKHLDQGVKLQCTQCPFQSMNKYIMKYHEEAHATGKKRYQCDQCDYATILPANLVQHKYKHSAEKKFKCDVCPFATKYNTSLRFHVKKKHCDLPSS